MIDSKDRYFMHVALTGSLRRASEVLNVSASAISRKVALLEASLGVELLERTPNGMELTEAGRVYLEYTRHISRDFENMQTEIGELRGLARGTVNIATVEGMLEDIVMPVVLEFRRKYPGIRLQLRVAGTHAVRTAVREREVDIGIAMSNGLSEDDFEVCHRFDDSLLAVAAPGHAIAGMRSARVVEMLERYRYALLDRSFGIRSIIDAHMGNHRAAPDFEANSFTALRWFIKNYSMLTFLPYLYVYHELRAGTLVGVELTDVRSMPMYVDIVVSRNRRISPPAKAMLQMFRSVSTYERIVG